MNHGSFSSPYVSYRRYRSHDMTEIRKLWWKFLAWHSDDLELPMPIMGRVKCPRALIQSVTLPLLGFG